MDTLDELTHVIRTATVGLALLDRNLRFLHMNEWLATSMGKPAEKQIGRTLEETFPEIAPQVVPKIRQAIETKEPVLGVEVEGPVSAELGIQKYWLTSYHPLKDHDGTVLQISIVFQDITENKLADKKLRSAQEYLDNILLNLPVGIAIMEGPEFRYFRINTRLAEINGLSVEDHLGKPLAEVLPDAAADIIPGLRTVLENGEPLLDREFSTKLPKDPDVTRHFIDSVFPIIGKDGEPKAVGAAVLDITKRKQAEEALQNAHAQLEERVEERTADLARTNATLLKEIGERKKIEENLRKSEARLASMLDIAADAVISVDVTQRMILFNKAAEQIFGYSADDVIGQSLDLLIPPRSQAIHRKRVTGFVRSASPARQMGERQPIYGRRANGEEFPAEAAISQIEVGGQHIVTVVLRDVTERKRAEASLEQQRGELAHVLRTATLGELTAALAHEINQPLTAILMNAQAAKRHLNTGTIDFQEFGDIIGDIIDDNRRAAEVIRHMRALLRKQEVDAQPLNIDKIVNEVITLIHSDAVIKGVDVSLDLAKDLPLVPGDRIQLQQVFLNLILNGFDAMQNIPIDKRLLVIQTVLRDENTICVSIKDTGVGFNEHDADLLFEPFHTTKADGLGMGLAISRSIIEAHGGKIWARKNPDQGATFQITLPVLSKAKCRIVAE